MGEQLDPDAAARVVRRAIELDAAARRGDEAVDAEVIVEAATEAGVAPAAVFEAIAWERMSEAPDPAPLDAVVGPRAVAVERVVTRDADSTLDRIDEWLRRGHQLRREFGEGAGPRTRVEWRKRADPAASFGRVVRSVAGGAELGSVRRLVVEVSPIDDDRAIVRLVADRHVGRNASLAAAGGVSAVSVVGGAVAATAVPPLALVALPGITVAGATVWTSKRSSRRLRRDLVRLLDHLECGRRPPTLAGRMARRIRAATDGASRR